MIGSRFQCVYRCSLQRGRRSESTEMSRRSRATARRSPSFKGAVDQSRRRYSYTCSSRHHAGCFKGAVDQSRRRSTARWPVDRRDHRFKGAVDQSRRRCRRAGHGHRADHLASKGPSIRVDGDAIASALPSLGVITLQRGRRSESTEMSFWDRCIPEPNSWLQRGRRSESTEMNGWTAEVTRVATLQRGRRSESTEMACAFIAWSMSPCGFKGAVDQSRRRYPRSCPSPWRAARFKGAVDQSRRR